MKKKKTNMEEWVECPMSMSYTGMMFAQGFEPKTPT